MKHLIVGLLASATSACVPVVPTYLVAPDIPGLGVRAPRYAAVTAGVRQYPIVDPLDWRELNRGVAPGDPERGDSDDAARRGR
jgi:hypothetical protein